MGEVWAATNDAPLPDDRPRDVAIKVLLPRAAMKPDLVRRFEREARIASAITSPYVCQLVEVGEADDGAHLLVFEQLTGESLSERLKREQYLPFSEVGPIIDDVLQGLSAAHAAGVIHRDLKPGNIFLEQLAPRGGPFAAARPASSDPFEADALGARLYEPEPRLERAKVLDFGISKLTRREKDDLTLTAFDATLGSFAYMAPEQVRGAARADERADIYAVGAVAFRALSGRLPFEGMTASLLVAMKLDRAAPSLHQATGDHWPAGLERFLERALERKKEQRFGTAIHALAAWRSIQPANITRARRSAERARSPALADPQGTELPPPFGAHGNGAAPSFEAHAAGMSSAAFPVGDRVSQAMALAGAVPPPARPPAQSYVPVEDHPTEVDGPPSFTVEGLPLGIDPRESTKQTKSGRPHGA